MKDKRYNADWWSKDYDSGWERVKDAFRRDWEQTKHDFGGDAPDLKQNVDDTVKQAVGKQKIPPSYVPNFEAYEPAFRFGYGARQHYGTQYPSWDKSLETTLHKDWTLTGSDDDWDRYMRAIRTGYEYQSAKTTSSSR